MTKSNFRTQRSEGALGWMISREMIIRKTTKDPETYAAVHGFILSDQLRDMIGTNLVKLVGKAARKKNGGVARVSIRDAFLTATMAAVLEMARVTLSDEEMACCANLILALLQIRRLEEAGLADRSLRTVARDRSSVQKLQDLFGPQPYLAF